MSFDQLVVDPNYTAEEMLERIGELADTADNYRTYTEVPLRNTTVAIAALNHGLTEIRNEARAIYIALGGDADTWEANDV